MPYVQDLSASNLASVPNCLDRFSVRFDVGGIH